MSEGTLQAIKRELKLHAAIILSFLTLIWVLELTDLVVLGGALDGFGIRPREASGLPGILAAPFLHLGVGHLLSNSLPFAVLGWLVLLRETRHFFIVSVVVTLLGGLGVWLVGASGSCHIGASGLIFGYFGYLLLAGWFERRFGSILLSLLVLVGYGGLIFGVLPGQEGISWEGHLFGFLSGILCARLLARRRPKDPDAG